MSAPELSIHDAACRGCRFCVDICPTEVFGFDDAAHRATVDRQVDCVGCLSCAYLCPSKAISHQNVHKVKNYYRDLTFTSRMGRFV